MTLRTQLEGILELHEIPNIEAKMMIDYAISEIKKDPNELSVEFDNQRSDYDTSVIRAAYLSIKPLIVKWIDTNKPQVWYRSLFV